jgi:hypothetical protein
MYDEICCKANVEREDAFLGTKCKLLRLPPGILGRQRRSRFEVEKLDEISAASVNW